NADTELLFRPLAQVRNPASHGGTEISADNARECFIRAKKILEAIDPISVQRVRDLEHAALDPSIKAPNPPLTNFSIHDIWLNKLFDRIDQLRDLETKVSQKYGRVVSVTGRGGVGK